MRSIEARLTLALSGASIVLVTVAGLVLYRSIGSYLVRQFDSNLVSQASAISSIVSFNEHGELEFEYAEAAALEPRLWQVSAGYYVVRFDDGRVFAVSSSLRADGRLPAAGETVAKNVPLDGGHLGRAVRFDFLPTAEPDAPKSALNKARGMNITLARDRAPLDASLNYVLGGLILTGALLTAAIAGGTVLIVRRSLLPLRAIADRATQITPSTLDLRFPTDRVPAEIRPICLCLNELLDRLDAAFGRERRFSSNIAHELRTPIAELRSLADVALRWPDDPQLARDGLIGARQVAQQMQTIVATLLTFVRAERMPEISRQPLSLRKAMDNAIQQLSADREISRVALSIPDGACVRAEATLLGSVLRNLLANALEYGEQLERVVCEASPRAGQWTLSIRNKTSRLQPRDIPHLFEPFWRKDAARTSSTHSGLGLSLVKAYCDLMQIDLRAELTNPETFEIRLSILAAQPLREPDSSSLAHVPLVT